METPLDLLRAEKLKHWLNPKPYKLSKGGCMGDYIGEYFRMFIREILGV